MKCLKLLLILFWLFGSTTFYSQISINTDGSEPHNSAILDIKSTSKGLLFPRMTTGQIKNIWKPAAGLLVFNTDSSDFYGYNGNVWIAMWDISDTLVRMCEDSIFYSGQWYTTVQIGTQCWMAENLRTSEYRNGDLIPNVKNGDEWLGLTSGACCWHGNDSADYEIPYGKMYNHYAVADSRGLCPADWHVSTDGEWTTLVDYLGGGTVAGGKLKESGLTHWQDPNTGATDASGFTGLPGGVRGDYGFFTDLSYYGYFWTSTIVYSNHAWTYVLSYTSSGTTRNDYAWKYGWNVRCVKD